MLPNYLPALELAQRNLSALDPKLVAARSGAELTDGEKSQELHLKLFSQEYRIPLPEALAYSSATGAQAGISTTLLLLHYLTTADGSPSTGEWITFREIPGGDIYVRAFRQQCVEPLIAAFGRHPEALEEASPALGGRRDSMGDLSFVFQALPRLPMACVLWLADEEQGAEVSLLFDAVAPRYLPTEDLAALGRALTFGLIRSAGRKP